MDNIVHFELFWDFLLLDAFVEIYICIRIRICMRISKVHNFNANTLEK